MQFKSMRELLPLVECPSRYLGSETNSIHKDFSKLKLRMALAFPDLYEIGMSHFGLQILYHILNQDNRIWAERVFAPGLDMAARLKQTGVSLSSLESATPLSRFDIIGFSLLYELNYTNILLMLDLAGIPFYSSDRDSSHPIIIAGGPCTVNPEPVADFFDAMVVGDGEQAAMEMANAFMQWKDGGRRDKSDLLNAWADIEGVYVPSLFSATYDESGRQQIHPKKDSYIKVSRAIVSDLDKAEFPDKPVVGFARPVHDRLRLELARGCTRGCRFCQAGMIYRPVRERTEANLLDLAQRSLAATGYEDISLLSLSTGDYGCLTSLMHQLFLRYAEDHVALSFPSFRAGTLTSELMDMIRRIRKTGFTIAPEAGTDRLRNVINKNITEADIIGTVTNAFQLGWKVFKLYFMIGLPTETQEDICAISDLVNRIKRVKHSSGRSPDIHVSVSTFIPKPHTPFQWEPQNSLKEAKDKIENLRHRLNIRGVHFKWQKPETSLLEGILARGDRRLSRLIESAYIKGCRFDGWSDSFQFKLWEEAFKDAGIDVDFYTTRKRAFDEPLPWDHIDVRVSKAFLTSEFHKAVHGTSTPDCRSGKCQGCGVCDFKMILPKAVEGGHPQPFAPEAPKGVEAFENNRINISYEKKGPARYFGHLELVNIFFRAIRRAGIPVRFTEGFHPKPKISFHDALPVGMESVKETFRITLLEKRDCDKIISDLNHELPEGIVVSACAAVDAKAEVKLPDAIVYEVTLPEGKFDQNKAKRFHDADHWVLSRKMHQGDAQEIDLKETVVSMDHEAENKIKITLRKRIGKNVRPAEVIKSIFNFSDDLIRRANIIKIGETEPFNQPGEEQPETNRQTECHLQQV